MVEWEWEEEEEEGHGVVRKAPIVMGCGHCLESALGWVGVPVTRRRVLDCQESTCREKDVSEVPWAVVE